MTTAIATKAGLLTLWQKAIRSDPDLHEVASQLSTLPDLATATLRFANSAYMGATYPVGSVLQAVVRVGCRAVGSLAAARLGRTISAELGNEKSWSRALVIGRGAKVSAKLCGLTYNDTEELFVAGLFAEVGYLISAADDGRYRQWMSEARAIVTDDRELLSQEKQVFGATHTGRAGVVLGEWNLPPQIGSAVANHHDPRSDFERVLAAAMTLPEDIACMRRDPADALAELGLGQHAGFIMREAAMFADSTVAAFA